MVIERFIIQVKLCVTTVAASFRGRAEILSRPLALLPGIL